MDILGGSLTLILFILYFILWKVKRRNLLKSGGVDPEVFAKSKSNLQRYIGVIMKLLTLYAAAIMILHTIGLQYASLFSRFVPLNHPPVKIAGFIVGLSGLSLCGYAQIKMGLSWRVGIDPDHPSDLVMTGLYRLIRNPTYLGLYLLNLGVWLIWPTWTVFLLNLLFVYTLAIQVRCEEDFLASAHGAEYDEYKSRTKRYIPMIY